MSCTISFAKATLAFCYSKLLVHLVSAFFSFFFLKRHWTVISCWTIFKNCYHTNHLLLLWLQGIEKLHRVISNSVISGPSFLWNPWASTICSWHLLTVFITLLYKLLCWQFKQRQIFQWVLFSIKRLSGMEPLWTPPQETGRHISHLSTHGFIIKCFFHFPIYWSSRILHLSCFWWTWIFFFCYYYGVSQESLWQVLVFFIWLATVHVLIYFSGQLHDFKLSEGCILISNTFFIPNCMLILICQHSTV